MLEGKRLISDAIEAGVELKTIYFSLEENLIGIPHLEELVIKHGVGLKKVFYKHISLFTDVVTSPGVIGIFNRPELGQIFGSKLYRNEANRLPITLIGDNIRDPGNLGTLIRCAAAIGVEKVICTKGCVDAWESKVLRAGAGAHFRVPVINDLPWPYVFNYLPTQEMFRVYLAECKEQLATTNVDSRVSRESCDFVPNKIITEVDKTSGQHIIHDDSYQDEKKLQAYKAAPIDQFKYTDITYYNDTDPLWSSVVVIGGEAQGLSNQAFKLAHDFNGQRINIPLSYGVESLNSAVAASVILYEIKRQYESIVEELNVSIKKIEHQTFFVDPNLIHDFEKDENENENKGENTNETYHNIK